MTVVRFKNKPNGVASFNNLLSDLFPPVPSLYREDAKLATPVNIKETENEFVVELVAPGFLKEDFDVKLEGETLTISAEKKEDTKSEKENVIRNEYRFNSFQRSFTMDDQVDAENISAQYICGVLTLNLPKREEVKPATKQIAIN